jgi:hypothetical protein
MISFDRSVLFDLEGRRPSGYNLSALEPRDSGSKLERLGYPGTHSVTVRAGPTIRLAERKFCTSLVTCVCIAISLAASGTGLSVIQGGVEFTEWPLMHI